MDTFQEKSVITQAHIDKSLDYETYRQLIDALLAEGKSTGSEQSESLTHYTKMNVQRMRRWDKTTQIREDLKEAIEQIDNPQIWLILTEGWCGDAAQNIPFLVKFAALNPKIEIRFLLRDENLEVMDAYLTNGGRSIPKLIVLQANTFEELGTWGPRPAEVQQMVMDFKKSGGDYKEFSEQVHKWYAKDKGQALQKEFLEKIQSWK